MGLRQIAIHCDTLNPVKYSLITFAVFLYKGSHPPPPSTPPGGLLIRMDSRQASFASSGGHRALLQAGIAASAAEPTASSLALRRAILHALSSSVMGLAEGEGALCSEPGFQEFLSRALSQEGERQEGEGGGEGEVRVDEEIGKLRSKAAFVLKVRLLAFSPKSVAAIQ